MVMIYYKYGCSRKKKDSGCFMRVKCVICDKIESINDESLLAKRLRNRPIHTYMCDGCNFRISEKTKARISTGNFHLYRARPNNDDW
jgi:uncharacterized protein YlaI